MLARAGFLGGRAFIPIPRAADLIRRGYPALPEHIFSALAAFWRVRNQIIHEGEGDRDDILRAIDSGLMVLKTLRGIPMNKYVVLHTGAEVYAYDEGKTPRDDVKAVVIENISAGGLLKSKHVFPTTRTHFNKGMEVAWEWNDNAKWGESWYRDPESNEIVYGWTSPMEFIGRDLRDFDRASKRADESQ
jgi:hypothetical protein